jgi:hypothetical protein
MDNKNKNKQPYVIRIEIHNDTDYLSLIMSNNKKMKANKCPGCYPELQPNQEAHIGVYGCLGDYEDILFNS